MLTKEKKKETTHPKRAAQCLNRGKKKNKKTWRCTDECSPTVAVHPAPTLNEVPWWIYKCFLLVLGREWGGGLVLAKKNKKHTCRTKKEGAETVEDRGGLLVYTVDQREETTAFLLTSQVCLVRSNSQSDVWSIPSRFRVHFPVFPVCSRCRQWSIAMISWIHEAHTLLPLYMHCRPAGPPFPPFKYHPCYLIGKKRTNKHQQVH